MGKLQKKGLSRYRFNYEIHNLKALREKLYCKEIWVVGANRYRHPDNDLPTDFEQFRQHTGRQYRRQNKFATL